MVTLDRKEISVKIGKHTQINGILSVPHGTHSIVIFSHGSGSSRFSVRNNFVADILNKEKVATLLTDLLTEEEDRILENRFNIDLLTERLIEVTIFVSNMPELKSFKTGYFGASTGAASALKAASKLPEVINGIVSRGGRPDLAYSSLKLVKAPTLLIVGSLDTEVIMLNKQAYSLMYCEKKIEIIPGATHLFEEPGKLEKVASLACDWFLHYLGIADHFKRTIKD